MPSGLNNMDTIVCANFEVSTITNVGSKFLMLFFTSPKNQRYLSGMTKTNNPVLVFITLKVLCLSCTRNLKKSGI